ncbi:hypothetical protein [Sinorhizobium americanum]|uniref:Transmembrane protein n=1 Tax=Sinorhizobium americanum TaxID=194963 RepID=A0A4R2BSS5_9HYPH|nr:hypothetical protein [Sinorhizobium americanum]TCN29024.1 hypothetical protein EV184_111126 [Sinorhizobium americanum]
MEIGVAARGLCRSAAPYSLSIVAVVTREEKRMSQEWPMFILQCIVVFGLVSALFIRFGE